MVAVLIAPESSGLVTLTPVFTRVRFGHRATRQTVFPGGIHLGTFGFMTNVLPPT